MLAVVVAAVVEVVVVMATVAVSVRLATGNNRSYLRVGVAGEAFEGGAGQAEARRGM